MNKRVLFAAISSILILTLSACGSSATANTTEQTVLKTQEEKPEGSQDDIVPSNREDTVTNTGELSDSKEDLDSKEDTKAGNLLDEKITYKIPDGLVQGDYLPFLVTCFEGYPLIGEQPVTKVENDAPFVWTVNGGIGISLGDSSAVYENHELINVMNVTNNHMGPVSEPYVTNINDFDAYVVKYSFDLFTAAEMAKYEEKTGRTLTGEEATSRYWYAYLCNENDTEVYVVFLNADQYTEEDLLAFASTVKKK